MNFKMREKSLFAVLLRSPWWASVLIAIAMATVAAALLPANLVPFGVAGCIPFVVIACMAAWKQRNAIKPERLEQLLTQAAAMPWRDFSAKLTQAYEAQGYTVSSLSNGAADLKLVKFDDVTLVCAKRYKAATHGADALRDLALARDKQSASHCVYVSLGPVTEQARLVAKEQRVLLLTGADLVRAVLT